MSSGKIISLIVVAIWFAYPLALIITACLWWPFGPFCLAVLLLSGVSVAWLERRLHRGGLHSIDILKRKFGVEDALRSFLQANVQPRFHDTETLPATAVINANFEAISEELLGHIDRDRGGFRNAYDNAWMPTGDHWKAINLLGWGLHNSIDLPVTRGVLHEVEAINCNISRLAPDSEIHRHYGESNAYIRCHLPLRVPGELPEVGLEVGGQKRSWRVGELVAFTDLHHHGALNRTDEERIVLIFDVMHPDHERARGALCSRWLVNYSFLIFSNAVARTFKRRAATKIIALWGHLFYWLSLPLRLPLWFFFRFLCVRPPFWFKMLRQTAFYF